MVYNGYRNRATWAMAHVVNNEAGLYEGFTAAFEESSRMGRTYGEAVSDVAWQLQELAEEVYEDARRAMGAIPSGNLAVELYLDKGPYELNIDYEDVARSVMEEGDYRAIRSRSTASKRASFGSRNKTSTSKRTSTKRSKGVRRCPR